MNSRLLTSCRGSRLPTAHKRETKQGPAVIAAVLKPYWRLAPGSISSSASSIPISVIKTGYSLVSILRTPLTFWLVGMFGEEGEASELWHAATRSCRMLAPNRDLEKTKSTSELALLKVISKTKFILLSRVSKSSKNNADVDNTSIWWAPSLLLENSLTKVTQHS